MQTPKKKSAINFHNLQKKWKKNIELKIFVEGRNRAKLTKEKG